MKIDDVPSVYNSSDIIYHYTKTETALLHILADKQLRLTHRNSSSDPIENTKSFYSFSSDEELKGTEHEFIAHKVKDEVKSLMDKTKQLCLCKNLELKSEKFINYLPFEKYGFAKPRMWDQYGDKYQSVCLALSKTELIKGIDSESVIHKDIDYISYKKLKEQHKSIDATIIKYEGRETYKNVLIDFAKNRLFKKHEDYIGENEYRFCSFKEGAYDYIDISKALKGILMSDLGLNRKLYYVMQDELNNYDDVQFSIMSFSGLGISIKDAKNHFKLRKSVDEKFEKLNQNTGLI